MRASVRSKIVFIASAAMLLAVAANTAFSGYFFAAEYSNVVRSEADVIGRFLKLEMEKIMGYGLPIGQVTGFDSQCQDVVDRYGIVLHAYVTDVQGKILFRSSGVDETHAIGPVAQAAKDGVRASVFHQDEIEGDHYDFVVPVSSGGTNVGAVVIGIPVEVISGRVFSLVLFSSAIAAIVFIVAVALLFVALSSWVTSPLTKLSAAVQGVVKGGEMKAVDIRSDDEIGGLAASFNTMIAELKLSNEKMKQHTRELEGAVSERTKVLDQKLTELTDTKTAVLNMMEDMENANRELMETKGKLEDSFGKLKEVDVKKDEFISIAAHELKTPLTSIHGFSQLLRDKRISTDAGKRDKYLEIIDKESMRLAKLVNEILDLSRIDLGTIRFALDEVDLNALMESMMKEMEMPIKAKGLKLESSIEKDLPKISTDRERLTQVLINLLTNAMKYTPHGKITLTARKEVGSVRFSVKDTGLGIAKENHPHIFQRFYQVDSSYTRSAGGTGLGLSLCKEFVTRLGGQIRFESVLGKGSEFIFTLPLKVPAYVRRLEKEGIDLPAEAKKKEKLSEKDAAMMVGGNEGVVPKPAASAKENAGKAPAEKKETPSENAPKAAEPPAAADEKKGKKPAPPERKEKTANASPAASSGGKTANAMDKAAPAGKQKRKKA